MREQYGTSYIVKSSFDQTNLFGNHRRIGVREQMVNVLIVEDSAVAREHLNYILSSTPDIQVVAMAKDGEEAVKLALQVKPDVITMDIHMPKMDGLETTRHIMATHPAPIIIVSSSWKPHEVERVFLAMEAGALAVVEKPMGIGHPRHKAMAEELAQTVRLMSEVKVIKRWTRSRQATKSSAALPRVGLKPTQSEIKLVAIGSSTGGPSVLQTILSGLPQDFSIPILIVQHIAAGFLNGLVEWLGQRTCHSISVATHGEKIKPGHVYFAPDDWHMGIGRYGQITLSQSKPEDNLRPAVSYLLRSVAESFGPQAAGVLLTGMGQDGARDLKLMRDKGAITIAQNEESSVIFGMPGEAVKLGAAAHVLSPDEIVTTLIRIVNRK